MDHPYERPAGVASTFRPLALMNVGLWQSVLRCHGPLNTWSSPRGDILPHFFNSKPVDSSSQSTSPGKAQPPDGTCRKRATAFSKHSLSASGRIRNQVRHPPCAKESPVSASRRHSGPGRHSRSASTKQTLSRPGRITRKAMPEISNFGRGMIISSMVHGHD